MPEKKNQKQKNESESDEKPDFSFKEDVHTVIDKAIEERKKKTGPDEFRIEHVSDKVRFAKSIKENPPDKGFMQIDADEAIVEYEDEYGRTKKEKGIAITSYHEKIDEKTGKVRKFKKINIHKGIFAIDLNVDAYFWFVRACNIFPLILDQGIRTHLDIKKAHMPEKRRHEFPWILIGLVITGIIFIFMIFRFIFMK